MSERSGIGAVQVAILEALAARPGRGFRPNEKVLREAERRIGLAPWYAYPVLVDLAQPWKMPATLIEGQGNYGSRGNDPAAGRRYTESRLTHAGRLALAAERRDLAPVPVGLINGNTYRDGTQPPFRPPAVIEAIRHVMQHPKATGQEIVSMIGPPDFITSCTRHQLSTFGGLHMTPPDCLHMTTLVAGPADSFSQAQRQQMLQTAADQLADVSPITVSLSKILYHPEAIIIAVTPGAALAPLRSAAITATCAAGHHASDQDEEWKPHVSLCYSTSDQPARPIIQALGMSLPEKTITVPRLSLVIQTGSELAWDWTVVGSADLAAPAPAQATRSGR